VSYTVLIPAPIKRDIATWGLPRELHLEVYRKLIQELAANPDAHLGEVIVPLLARSYSFTLVDNQRLPHQHVFMFAIERDDASRVLRVVGCRHSTEDTGTN